MFIHATIWFVLDINSAKQKQNNAMHAIIDLKQSDFPQVIPSTEKRSTIKSDSVECVFILAKEHNDVKVKDIHFRHTTLKIRLRTDQNHDNNWIELFFTQESDTLCVLVLN